MKEYKEYEFFYPGPFSNWHPCKFVDMNGIEYNCSEQYMMYYKALLFGDYNIATYILEEDHPAEQKAMGRLIKGFDLVKWNHFAREIVWLGCYYKFTQNEHLKEALFATEGKLLVEASPYDRIWGIGLGLNSPDLNDPSKWDGTNWLGEVLTDLRERLML